MIEFQISREYNRQAVGSVSILADIGSFYKQRNGSII